MHLVEKLRLNASGASAGILLAVATGIILLFLHVADGLDHLSYDLPHRIAGEANVPTNAVIVYLDEDSARELGQDMNQPWDRSLHGELIAILKADGARAVVFDIIFASEGEPAATAKLANAIQSYGKVVLGAELFVDTSVLLTNIVAPKEQLGNVSKIGLVTLDPEENNVVRKYWDYHAQYPSLARAAVEIEGNKINLEKDRQYWLRYYGPQGAIPFVSYYKVMLGLPKGFFQGKTVFIGAKPTTGFAGTGKDEFLTPYDLYSPGVEIHATAFLNLIHGELLRWIGAYWQVAITLFLGVIAGGIFALCVPWLSALIALLLTALILAGATVAWQQNIWLNWVVLLVQVGVALLWSIVYNSLNWYVQRKVMLDTLSVHLSPARAKAVLKQPDLLKPGAEMQEITILFSDIADFSAISEKLPAQELAKELNEYFETSISTIHHSDGTVVKLIGDAIFAIWNAPNIQENHQRLACLAALNLREQLATFAKTNPELTKFKTRVGLHTGMASVGNFGSKSRFDYTAIGDSVNLASRLEGLNKFMGTDILISDELLRGLPPGFLTRSIGKFRFKGFDRAIEVHELISASNGAIPQWHADFNSAVPLFQTAEFDKAAEAFSSVLSTRQNDGPARFYLEQIASYRQTAPALNFSGIIEMKEK